MAADVQPAVLQEFRHVYNEIFGDNDSDDEEFEGFEIEDLNNNEYVDPMDENSWVVGGKAPTNFTFVPKVIDDNESFSYLDYFQQFLTMATLEIICNETNKYASAYIESNKDTFKEHSRFKKWKDTSVRELHAFFAVIIAMGLVHQIDIQDYWSTDCVIATPFFSSVMPRDRFLLILTFLDLNDNATAVQRGDEGYTPLQKLGKPFQDIKSNFINKYSPSKNLAVDEGMIPWRGNLHFRVYNPDKPVKYGMKLYMLCDSDNGFCHNLELYTGKESLPEPVSQFGATYDLVMRLLTNSNCLNRGHHIYMDNYFTSPRLFYDLYLHSTHACGTLRSNRKGVPPALKYSKPVKGDIHVLNNGTLVAVKYADKKDVCLLTTIHEGKLVNTRTEGELKPDCVLSYNLFMGAVDRCDQMVQYGNFDRKTLKWWKKVFFHLIGLSVLNAFLMHKKKTGSQILQRVFKRELVKQLLEAAEYVGAAPKGRKRQAPEVLQRLTERHFLQKSKPTTNTNGKRKCIVCNPGEAELFKVKHPGIAIPKRPGRESTYFCKQCKVPLCVVPCNEIFHSKADYVNEYKHIKLQENEEE